jgi:hypothetical protein
MILMAWAWDTKALALSMQSYLFLCGSIDEFEITYLENENNVSRSCGLRIVIFRVVLRLRPPIHHFLPVADAQRCADDRDFHLLILPQFAALRLMQCRKYRLSSGQTIASSSTALKRGDCELPVHMEGKAQLTARRYRTHFVNCSIAP